ncbi:AAA family ATPase [Alkalicella caledoniensis]|uniref:AAA family ATPase n=1 Tax=Alkalicella caledoniensis TaxID=2731377 RepID=A0A7G9W8C1_ALKCA|nr:HNH endonuclease [Alkalicella caledoniensis]QNO14933.1 AAA family ATPase [Alkalicella caledoniensis]
MAKYEILQRFYASDEWQKFRLVIISERGLKCEHCGERVANARQLTLHHIIELTPENVNDAAIALNPNNVLVVHHDCHNKIHKRFGYQNKEKKVYIVYGPPLSGKSRLVERNVNRGDIVVDMDRLYAAVTMLPYYDKPDSLLNNVRGIHNLLIDNTKTRHGKWHNAWIIGGYADRHKRERLANDLGAELIFCDVSKEECISRLKVDEDRQHRADEWIKYIEKWFETYLP